MNTACARPRGALALLPWIVLVAACRADLDPGPRPGETRDEGVLDAGAEELPDARAEELPDAKAEELPDAKAEAGCDSRTQAQLSGAVDKVDLLFMVDNSASMSEEQAALREQFPRLIRTLTTGDQDGDGSLDFAPARELHLGVVSSDMGLVGVPNPEVLHCTAAGDDGLLLHVATDPLVQSCQRDYPTFVTYQTPDSDPVSVAGQLGCIASLGTTGCGFEQQLEAALKALWPSKDSQGMPNMAPEGGPFLAVIDGGDSSGHGDRENAGFLHNDVAASTSLIVVVLITDEEDCSSKNTHHFIPARDLPPDDPVRRQAYFEHSNLRCFENKPNLWPIERYVKGFKALRAGQEERVMFAAIAGLPPEAVGASQLAAVDFSDAQQREQFYAGILDSPQMTETVDPLSLMEPGAGNLRPSCESARGVAYPPRRIVEVARQFGENAVVQSICNDDMGQAIDAITSMIGRKLRTGSVAQPAGTDRCK